MTKTHGKLKHDYITGSCAHGHDLFGGPTKENSYSVYNNIGSGRPNLIMHCSVANL